MMIIIIKGCDSTFMSCNFQKLGWNEYILCSYMKLKDIGVIERVVNKETEKYDSMTFTWTVFNIHMFAQSHTHTHTRVNRKSIDRGARLIRSYEYM